MKIVAAMSGGVDSSAAALLLKKAGHNVVGVTILNLAPSAGCGRATCCGAADIGDAQRVCARLGIPHHVLDMRREFAKKVILPFVSEYARGRTPNPCVECNASVRIPRLLSFARKIGARALATGHYARIRRDSRPLHSPSPEVWDPQSPCGTLGVSGTVKRRRRARGDFGLWHKPLKPLHGPT